MPGQKPRQVRARYCNKLSLTEKKGGRHFKYQIVTPSGKMVGNTVLPFSRDEIGRKLAGQIAKQFRLSVPEWEQLVDCTMSAETYFSRFD